LANCAKPRLSGLVLFIKAKGYGALIILPRNVTKLKNGCYFFASNSEQPTKFDLNAPYHRIKNIRQAVLDYLYALKTARQLYFTALR